MTGQRGQPGGTAASAPWTTRRLLRWMNDHFKDRDVDSPRVVAEMLLSHVLGCERMRLYMEADRPASPSELTTLRGLVRRAASHEPAQYLVGHAWFFSRRFEVDRSTLIPRPSTETLVEHVLQWRRVAPGPGHSLIADVGTGTGCIAVSLAAQLTQARLVATDISEAALALARRNAQRHDVASRVEFRLGPGLDPLSLHPGADRYDVICSNPPYIPDHEWQAVPRNVREYEPASALRGGADGLDLIRPLIAGAGALLAPGGQLVLEIADCQRDAVIAMTQAAGGFELVNVLKDHEGLWRVLVAERAR